MMRDDVMMTVTTNSPRFSALHQQQKKNNISNLKIQNTP